MRNLIILGLLVVALILAAATVVDMRYDGRSLLAVLVLLAALGVAATRTKTNR